MTRRTAWLIMTSCGFGLMLSLGSFTMWGIAELLGPASPWPQAAHELGAFCLPANVAAFALYGLAAAAAPTRFVRRPIVPACGLLLLGGGMLTAAFFGAPSEVTPFRVAGVLLGIGSALSYVCWELTLAQGTRDEARAAILLATVFSVVLYLPIAFCAKEELVVPLLAALICACVVLLAASCRLKASAEPAPPQARLSWKALWSDLAMPLACTMMLGLIGPAIGSFATLEPMGRELPLLLYQFGSLATAATLALCWFVLKKNPSIEGTFLVLVPAAVIALFLFPFWTSGYQGFVLAFGCFVFSLVSILMMLFSIELARRHGLGLSAVYCLFATGTYLAQVLAGALSGIVNGSDYPRQFQIIAVVVLLLWGLSVIGLLTLWRTRLKASRHTKPEPEAIPGEAGQAEEQSHSLESRCAALRDSHGLSPREFEVLELIGRGRDVAAIAEILCLSRNTVRTHIQRLYADLDVHTRQELIDLIERTPASKKS